MLNRSAPPGLVVPVIAYADVAYAVTWLESVFGFRVRLRIGNHRVQMWFGAACLIVGEQGAEKQWATRSSTLLRVADVDSVCDRATAQGAELIHPPKTQPYGERQATLKDFAGHTWTLTQSIKDVDPALWGGEAVELR
jgi:uncharacterized glyoxalase superfamily protein PhnB